MRLQLPLLCEACRLRPLPAMHERGADSTRLRHTLHSTRRVHAML